MATIAVEHVKDEDGLARAGEPMPRPYVVLQDGTTITYEAWMQSGQPD